MVPTKEWLEEKFRICNRKYFAGSLPTPNLIVSSNCQAEDSDCFGYYDLSDCIYNKWTGGIINLKSNGTLCLSNQYDRSEEAWINTLLHEMCHEYVNLVMFLYPRNPHGKEFKRVANRLNKYGWKITEENELDGTYVSNENNETGILCLLFKPNGGDYKYWVCRATNDNINEIKANALNKGVFTGISFYKTNSYKLMSLESNPSTLFGFGGQTYTEAIYKLCDYIKEQQIVFSAQNLQKIQ